VEAGPCGIKQNNAPAIQPERCVDEFLLNAAPRQVKAPAEENLKTALRQGRCDQ